MGVPIGFLANCRIDIMSFILYLVLDRWRWLGLGAALVAAQNVLLIQPSYDDSRTGFFIDPLLKSEFVFF